MKYLIDANVIITAERFYYPKVVFSNFWDQFANFTKEGKLVFLDVVVNEILKGDSDEYENVENKWIRKNVQGSELKTLPSLLVHYQQVINRVSRMANYTEAAKAEFARSDAGDAWLVSAAKYFQENADVASIVTYEKPAPGSSKRIKLPDICDLYGVKCITPVEMLRQEGVRF